MNHGASLARMEKKERKEMVLTHRHKSLFVAERYQRDASKSLCTTKPSVSSWLMLFIICE